MSSTVKFFPASFFLSSVSLASSLLGARVPVFEADVTPILDRSCASATPTGIAKSVFSMETRESLLQGG